MVLVKKEQHNNTVVPTHTIIHSCLDVTTVIKEIKKPNIVCNKNQSRKDIQGSPICLTYSGCDFLLDKIIIRDTIEHEKEKLLMRGLNKQI